MCLLFFERNKLCYAWCYVQMDHSNVSVLLLAYAAALSTVTIMVALYNQRKRRRGHSRRPRKRIANRNRHRSLANREKLQNLPEQEFAAGVRMSRSVFEQLLNLVQPVLMNQTHRKRKLPKNYEEYDRYVDPYVSLAFTLRWLAGAQRWDLCYMFDVAKTTLHVWTWRVIIAIVHVLKDNILFPTDEPSLDALAAGFANIAGGLGAAIPNTVCAFDGVVIQKCPPPQRKLEVGGTVTTNTAAHFYRKGYFGAAMMAFVDAKCRFLSISMACAASCHDSTMFDCSDAGRLLMRGLPSKKYNAVADDAFVTRGHILTPYVGHSLTPHEDAFNYYLSLQRQVVERAFGMWKRKFGIFWRTLFVSERHVKLIIEVTARLHNFCIDKNVSPLIDDYIAHDAKYWAAVKPRPIKHPRLREDPAASEPVLLDTSERAQFLPVDFVCAPQERSKRKTLCDAIAAQGLLRPPHAVAAAAARTLRRESANLPVALPHNNRLQ
jgi:hypothetical protein